MTPPKRDPVDTFLEGLGGAEPPPQIVDEIMIAVRRMPRRRAVARWGLTAAAIVLVGGGATAIWLGATHREPTPSPTPASSSTSGPVVSPSSGMTTSPTPSPGPSPLVLGTLPGSWVPIADAPIQGRQAHAAIWTGTEMIIWGGLPGPATVGDARGSTGMEAASYDPVSGKWRVLASASIVPRYSPAAVWTGREMLVWGGTAWSGSPAGDGAAYDPATDRWRHLPDAPFTPSGTQAAVWARDCWIVVDGGPIGDGPMHLKAAAYDPVRNSWEALPGIELPGPRAYSISWTGDEVIVLAAAVGGGAIGFHLNPGAVDPSPAWLPIAQPPLLRLNPEGPELFTGTEVLVASFVDGGGDRVVAYDAARDRWRAASPPPLGLGGGSNTWTGTLAAFGLGTGGMDRLTVYDPTRDAWFGLADAAGIHRESATQVWAGDRLLVWGGFEGESIVRPPGGFAFVPAARYANAAPELAGSGRALRVELVDASGTVNDTRTPSRAEFSSVDLSHLADNGTLIHQLGDRSAFIYWTGGPGDTAARVEIGTDGRTIDLVAVPTYGDAIPFGRAIVVTFNRPVNAAALALRLWNGVR